MFVLYWHPYYPYNKKIISSIHIDGNIKALLYPLVYDNCIKKKEKKLYLLV